MITIHKKNVNPYFRKGQDAYEIYRRSPLYAFALVFT
jgi:hypothetical protein